jgi:hypothetical protein
MWATGATPKKVTAMPIRIENTDDIPTNKQSDDKTAIILTQNDDNSVFRVTGCASFGGHHNAYRICGTKGQIENPPGMGEKVILRYNDWQLPEGAEEISCYDPSWNDPDEEFIKTSGHGGGDYLTARMFLDCIKEKRQPEHPFDIYSATVMSSVAILAHRSVLEGGGTFDIPDFRQESDRQKYENDRRTPFVCSDGRMPDLPSGSEPCCGPTAKQFELYMKDIESFKNE